MFTFVVVGREGDGVAADHFGPGRDEPISPDAEPVLVHEKCARDWAAAERLFDGRAGGIVDAVFEEVSILGDSAFSGFSKDFEESSDFGVSSVAGDVASVRFVANSVVPENPCHGAEGRALLLDEISGRLIHDFGEVVAEALAGVELRAG